MRLRRALLPLTVLLLVLVVAGCSSDDDGGNGNGNGDGSGDDSGSDATGTDLGSPDQTPPPGANGIKVADNGDLWITVLNGNELLRVDADSGEILQRVPTPRLSGPDDLVIDDDGTIYWTGFTSGGVGAIDPANGVNTEIANVGAGANPIAQRDDGMLVVGRAVTASGLFAVDPTGDREPEPLADPGNVNSFSIAPDGTLYAPLAAVAGGAAVAIDPLTGDIVETIAEIPGIPVALRWHDDQLFVLTLEPNGVVYRVDLATRTAELHADTGLITADNLAVNDAGEIFVTGFDQPVIAVFGPDGGRVRTLDIGG